MKLFHCQCGQGVFFDSNECTYCGARLAFDPVSMTMETLSVRDGQWLDSDGDPVWLCANSIDFGVCNWLVPAADNHTLCRGCRFNRVVPNQSLAGNQIRWQRLEEAKKRLLYTLIQLQLPLETGWEAPTTGLLFDFVEDERSQGVFPESFVSTGYLSGVITLNALEADDAQRETQRLQMNEIYRTVLGHMRHESGHYFWQRLNPDQDTRDEFFTLFGDESANYSGALDRHYRKGPPDDWRDRFISAYASAHPAEDWAESWGHYLHIHDALDTAAAHHLTDRGPDDLTAAQRITQWRSLSVTLNELNRSVGGRDAYPFVLNAQVEKKLEFVDRVIRQLQTLSQATAGH